MNSSPRLRTACICLVAACLVLGCQREKPAAAKPAEPTPAAAPGRSVVSIVSIEPDPGTPLRVGDQVKVHVVAAHTLDSDAGTIAIVVQDANNARITQNVGAISRGNANTTLEAVFVVPDTKAVQVFVPILAQGQGPTSTVDSRIYRVLPH
jgi:protein involved in polysaccharide export with SLBB domain